MIDFDEALDIVTRSVHDVSRSRSVADPASRLGDLGIEGSEEVQLLIRSIVIKLRNRDHFIDEFALSEIKPEWRTLDVADVIVMRALPGDESFAEPESADDEDWHGGFGGKGGGGGLPIDREEANEALAGDEDFDER
jgi:hypothetical protein